MTQAPARTAAVFFARAGLGSAFGVPNTQELLRHVHALAAKPNTWAASKSLAERLDAAYKYLYPIEVDDQGYMPDVVDFFSVLKTYTEVSEGLPGRLEGTRELQQDLRKALAHVLVNCLREADAQLKTRQPELDRLLQPGHFVITSNWDVLLERYAQHQKLPLRHRLQEPAGEVTLLKLHGSIDWCERDAASRVIVTDDYRTVRERLFGNRPYVITPTPNDEILRVTALEYWSQGWQRIRSRSTEPLLITMAMGKGADLASLRQVWRDAYGALSRAKELEIVGYSLPEDDIEIRTLLLAGIQRTTTQQKPKVALVVRNPSPEVHDRFRSALRRTFQSNYRPVNSVGH